jgi:hypothetical protein
MARGKAINVKIATAKVIKALEAKLATLEKDYATQTEKEAKFGKKQEAWKKEIAKWAIENFSKAEDNGTTLSMLILTSSQRKATFLLNLKRTLR